jgi:hypothetical protein
MAKKIDIKPQKGFQESFLETSADIAIGGGAAGCGKTTALLMEPLRHRKISNFGTIVFRRSYPEITVEGGLWDESSNMYPYIGAYPNKNDLQWNFLSGAKLTFKHMQNEKVLSDYQGAQIPLIEFDELTHFTKRMFIYLMTRNRSACGVRPYMRGSCNPDPDSFVAEFIDWWIDQESGFPDLSRCGKLRYMISDQNEFVWGDSRREVFEKAEHVFNEEMFDGLTFEQKLAMIKSVTFIPGTINDNQILQQKDPGYMGNLLAQDEDTKARLLKGNWKIRSDNKQLFDFLRLNDMFHNIVEDDRAENYIVVDHARFGRDLCVIGTWSGWKCMRIDIIPKSDTNFILQVIKHIRRYYGGIPTSNIIIDQDGIGVKDFLDCHSFHGGAAEHEIQNEANPATRVGKVFEKRGYKNKRAQLYFFLSEKVNKAEMLIDLDNVWFHESETVSYLVSKIKLRGRDRTIKDLIKEDLQKVKRERVDHEGKKEITPKDAIKNALGGRSPDFGDMLMMRCEFEFLKKKKYLR